MMQFDRLLVAFRLEDPVLKSKELDAYWIKTQAEEMRRQMVEQEEATKKQTGAKVAPADEPEGDAEEGTRGSQGMPHSSSLQKGLGVLKSGAYLVTKAGSRVLQRIDKQASAAVSRENAIRGMRKDGAAASRSCTGAGPNGADGQGDGEAASEGQQQADGHGVLEPARQAAGRGDAAGVPLPEALQGCGAGRHRHDAARDRTEASRF